MRVNYKVLEVGDKVILENHITKVRYTGEVVEVGRDYIKLNGTRDNDNTKGIYTFTDYQFQLTNIYYVK